MIRIFISLIMLFALSCDHVESLDEYGNLSPDAPLKIDASTTVSTKGELVYEPEDMGSIGLYCAMTGYETWSATTAFSKMNNRRYFISENGDWEIDGDAESWGYSSSLDKYTFFAYSPFDADTEGVTPRIEDGELIIDYAAPKSSIDQPDLMYAVPRKDIYAQVADGVSLNFHHALSSVSFDVISSGSAATDEQIIAIDISGIVSEGALSWDYKQNLPTWSWDELITETFSVEVSNYTLDNDTSTLINTERGYLMMIPQELTNGAEVTITLYGGNQRTLSIPAGTVWEAGLKYNYVIQLDEGEANFIFNSKEISNCYIINPTPGEATIVQIPIEDRINDFWKNYSGKDVEKITEASTTDEFTVTMVWEDFDGLFSFDYEVVDDADEKMAVLLTIPASYQEGNFVFAVQGDKGTNLWSWHLWFTDYNPYAIAAANKNNIEAGVDRKYELSGYEGAVHRYRDADSATVWSGIYKDKFIMDRNIGERNEYASNYGAGAVYYQFGRKDPFPGLGGWYSAKKTTPSVRSSSGFSFYQSVEFSVDLIFSSSSSSDNWSLEPAARSTEYIWFDENLLIDGYTEGKSIFDPSPFGWRVPVSDTWSYLDSVGAAYNSKSVGVYNYYGCRDADNSGALSLSGYVGYVWSANPTSTQSSSCLYYSDSLIVSPKILITTYGLPVRAIQE